MVHTKKFISFILVLAMVLSTMFAVSVPVFAVATSSISADNGGSTVYLTSGDCDTDDYPPIAADRTLEWIINHVNDNHWNRYSEIRVHSGDSTIQTVPYGNQTIYVSPSGIAGATLYITDYVTTGTSDGSIFNVNGTGYYAEYADLSIYDSTSFDIVANVSGTFDSITIDDCSITTLNAINANTVTIENGATVYINGGSINSLIVNGGTVYGYGTIGKANVNSGHLYLGYSDAVGTISGNTSTISKGLDVATGGYADIANTTISDSTLAFADDIGIVNISAGAVVNLNQDASIAQTESARTAAGTMLAVFNAGTFTMTGSSIEIKTDGTTHSKKAVALRGIYNYGSASQTYISSGSIQLINGNSTNQAIYNQGSLVIGDDLDDPVISITVGEGGVGILTTGQDSSATIYDASINITGENGKGIVASEKTNLEILSGPDTVDENIPNPTVVINAEGTNAIALDINDPAVTWSIAGGYKTARLQAAAGTALKTVGVKTPAVGHAVQENEKPLTAGYFIGAYNLPDGKSINNLIPSENYVVYDDGVGSIVIALTWEVRNAMEAATVAETGNTTSTAGIVTYSLNNNITYDAVNPALHGRVESNSVTIGSIDGRQLLWNGNTIDHYTSASATSTSTSSAFYYYAQNSTSAPNGSISLEYGIGSGAYLAYGVPVPGISQSYGDISSLIEVVNDNGYLNTLDQIVIFRGSHSLSNAPLAANTSGSPILVMPHGNKDTTLTISGNNAGTYYVMGSDDLDGTEALDYANLVVDAPNAVVYAFGEFATVTVKQGTLHLGYNDDNASYPTVVKGALTLQGGTLDTADDVTKDGNVQVDLTANVSNVAVTGVAIGSYNNVVKSGAGELTIGDETSALTYVNNGLDNTAGTTNVVHSKITATVPTTEANSMVYITGGRVNLCTDAAVERIFTTSDITDTIYGVVISEGSNGELGMTSGSSIYIEGYNTVAQPLLGIVNHGTAYLSGGSITLINGNSENIGVQSNKVLYLGEYGITSSAFSIDVFEGGKGVYMHGNGASTYVYGAYINVEDGGIGIEAKNKSNLIILAGPETVDNNMPYATVYVTADEGTALSIDSNANWAVAGGYKTAVFTGATALIANSTKTPDVSGVHDTNVYALQEKKPLTAGYFIGSVSGTYSLDQLVPSESASHSDATNYMVKDQTVVDLAWELKNVLEGDVITDSNYSGTTYTFPACINYGSVSNTLHGHYGGAQTATTTRSGITINLNTHYWTVTDGAVLNAGHNVTINGAGVVASTSGDAINHTADTLTLTNALVRSENGNAVKQSGGDLSADNVRFYADTEDVISISGGAVTISGGAVGALGAANKGIEHQGTGTLTILGTTITATGEAICIDSGDSFIEGATVTSTNNNAVHQNGGNLTITSGAFTSTVSGHGIWLDVGATKLTIVDGTFTAANGYGLFVSDHSKLTPLTAGTFSSVKNNTPSGILYQLVKKNGVVPAYTFRDSDNDLLSAWDLHAKQEITNGAIATFYRVNNTLNGNFTVVARPAYEVYYTSSEAITYAATSATALSGNSGDWYAMAFATGDAITVTATAIGGNLIKEAAHMTYGAFTKQGCSFAAIDLRGDAANQETYAVAIGGTEDYVMSVTGAAAKTITLSAVENFEHGEFGYKFVNAANGNGDYTVTPQAGVTVSAISGVAIKIASGNAISLGFKPDTDHAVHESTTSFGGLTFTASGGAFDTQNSLVTGTAVINDDYDVKVAFCDMTNPVPISTSGVITSRSTYTGAVNAIVLTGPTTNTAIDAHYLIDTTDGSWAYTGFDGGATDPAVTISAINGNKATVYSTKAGVATFTYTLALAPTAAGINATPSPITFTVTFTAPPSNPGGGGGGGGGGAAAASYDVSVTTDGSDIKTDKTKAAAGDTVTITVPEGTTGVTITDANGKAVEVTKVNDTTYTFKMPSSKVTVATEKATGLLRFIDVPMDKYFYDAVNWAVENGITTGTDATHFSPDALTDRAQFVTFLWRAAGSPEPTGDASAFKDVASDKYYAKAVAWAIENGITNGLEPDEFGPTVPVTRAHVVTFLYRFAKATGKYSSNFVDLKTGEFYVDAAGWAVENGITTGIDATHFNPDGAAVRAQTITFLYRYFTK